MRTHPPADDTTHRRTLHTGSRPADYSASAVRTAMTVVGVAFIARAPGINDGQFAIITGDRDSLATDLWTAAWVIGGLVCLAGAWLIRAKGGWVRIAVSLYCIALLLAWVADPDVAWATRWAFVALAVMIGVHWGRDPGSDRWTT